MLNSKLSNEKMKKQCQIATITKKLSLAMILVVIFTALISEGVEGASTPTQEIEGLSAEEWYEKGNTFYNLERYEEALECYDKASLTAEEWLEIGRYLSNRRRYEEVLECYDKALEIDPENAEAWLRKGQVLYYNFGRYEEALECIDKALEIDPEYVSVLHTKGQMLCGHLERYEEAIECYDKALEINPEDDTVWFSKGEVLKSLERYEEAIDCYDKALEIDPNFHYAEYDKIFVEGKLRENALSNTNPFPGLILATLLPLATIFLNSRYKKRKQPKIAKVIENWKANALTIPIIFSGFWAVLLLTAFVRSSIEIPEMVLNYGGILVSAIFCLLTAKILYDFFVINEISKNYSYLTIALSISCTILASFVFLDFFYINYDINESLLTNTLIIAVPLSIPGLVSLYTAQRYGEILIVKDKALKTPTTPTFPAELKQYYKEIEYIGGGGFGWVFRATREDGEDVAVKIPAIRDEQTGKIFIGEVEHWSALEHENIVKLGRFNIYPVPYLEMELCDGTLGYGKRSIEEAVSIVYEVAKGLKHAHERNTVHADIKHANILIKDGKLKISDWGLSKVIRNKSLYVSAITPEFAAPEQILGAIDDRTDIWQLGVVFYELVTGKLPFEGEYDTVINRVINDEPILPSKVSLDSKSVEQLIMKCLRKKKEERYQSVDELIEELMNYIPESGTVISTGGEELQEARELDHVTDIHDLQDHKPVDKETAVISEKEGVQETVELHPIEEPEGYRPEDETISFEEWEDTQETTEQETTEFPQLRFCSECGNELEEDAVFCTKCGYKVR